MYCVEIYPPLSAPALLTEYGISLSIVTKHIQVTIKLNTSTGLIILQKDKPTALNIVSSESLLNLSKVKSVPRSKPTGNALPRIFGSS